MKTIPLTETINRMVQLDKDFKNDLSDVSRSVRVIPSFGFISKTIMIAIYLGWLIGKFGPDVAARALDKEIKGE